MFPALGFGARMPDGSVSHEFPLVSLAIIFSIQGDARNGTNFILA